jgi:hypothetical protein
MQGTAHEVGAPKLTPCFVVDNAGEQTTTGS